MSLFQKKKKFEQAQLYLRVLSKHKVVQICHHWIITSSFHLFQKYPSIWGKVEGSLGITFSYTLIRGKVIIIWVTSRAVDTFITSPFYYWSYTFKNKTRDNLDIPGREICHIYFANYFFAPQQPKTAFLKSFS